MFLQYPCHTNKTLSVTLLYDELRKSITFFSLQSMIEESEREERHLQDEFRDLVMSLEMYLKPVTQQFESVFT